MYFVFSEVATNFGTQERLAPPYSNVFRHDSIEVAIEGDGDETERGLNLFRLVIPQGFLCT
jgi:hypothetical protein